MRLKQYTTYRSFKKWNLTNPSKQRYKEKGKIELVDYPKSPWHASSRLCYCALTFKWILGSLVNCVRNICFFDVHETWEYLVSQIGLHMPFAAPWRERERERERESTFFWEGMIFFCSHSILFLKLIEENPDFLQLFIIDPENWLQMLNNVIFDWYTFVCHMHG